MARQAWAAAAIMAIASCSGKQGGGDGGTEPQANAAADPAGDRARAEAEKDLLAALVIVVRGAGLPEYTEGRMLVTVAEAYERQGDAAKATAILALVPAKVKEEASKRRGKDREEEKAEATSVLGRWRAAKERALALGKAGKLDEARKELDRTGISGDAESVMAAAGIEAAKAGHVDEAIDLGRGMAGERNRASVLAAAGAHLAEAGEREKAVTVLEEACTPALSCSEKDADCERILGDVAAALAGIGETDRAWEVADRIEDAQARDAAFDAISSSCIKAGDLDRAEKAALLVECTDMRQYLMGGVMGGIAAAGDAKRTIEVATRIARSFGKDECVPMVIAIRPAVDALVAAGEVGEAEGLGKGIADPDCGAAFRIRLGLAHAKAGSHEEAMETIGALDTEREEEFLEQLAALYAAAGDIEHARKTMDAMLASSTTSITSWDEQAGASLAVALAVAGKEDEAIEVAEQFPEGYGMKGTILAKASIACLDAGRLECAERMMALVSGAPVALVTSMQGELAAGELERGLFLIHFLLAKGVERDGWAVSEGYGWKQESVESFLGAYARKAEKIGGAPEVERPEVLELVLALNGL